MCWVLVYCLVEVGAVFAAAAAAVVATPDFEHVVGVAVAKPAGHDFELLCGLTPDVENVAAVVVGGAVAVVAMPVVADDKLAVAVPIVEVVIENWFDHLKLVVMEYELDVGPVPVFFALQLGLAEIVVAALVAVLVTQPSSVVSPLLVSV